jgi:hypothetical protein
MMKRKTSAPSPEDIAAQRENDLVRKAHAALRTELEQAHARADEVLERLRRKEAAPLRLVKAR